MAKPTFVLVHGAWHTPTHFERLTDALTAHSYKSVAPALPSVAQSHLSPPPTGEDDAMAVREAVLSQLEHGDVIVVPHSYGGVPTTAAMKGLDTKSRHKAGHSTSVVAVAALSSFVLAEGATARETLEQPALSVAEMGETLPPYRPEALFPELSAEDKQKYIAMLRPISVAALATSASYNAHEVIPVHYLMAGDDLAIPIRIQHKIVDSLRPTACTEIRTELLEGCGHAPFLTRVDETVAFLRRSAGETV